MRALLHEIAAGAAVVLAVALLPWALMRAPARSTGPERVITLTGVKKDGAWTDEVVDGTNYWRKKFRPAALALRRGEPVLLRLTSADVRHGFYAPELGLGPVSIDPGKVVELRFTPSQEGEFTYYCTEVCGHCHYRMKGTISVAAAEAAVAPAASETPCHEATSPPLPPPRTLVERGARLFSEKGCETCHGARGSGGVRNPNYLAGTVPQNNLLAEKMGLFEREDAELAIRMLERREDPSRREGEAPFRSWAQFVAQYQAVRKLILDGNRAGKKDPALYQPPLNMPAWRHHLSDEDVDACIAFLLSQYPWDDEEG